MTAAIVISAAVEGLVDEAVARKVIACAGGRPGPVYGKNGKHALRRQIRGYNNAARHAPWLVLVDLNSDAECAPPLRAEWLPDAAPFLSFRVAVRQVEAWLMADDESLASYLGVVRGKLPRDPEMLPNAKAALVKLARASPRRSIREDMVPREGSGRTVGPAYTSRLIEYVVTRWRPERAAQRAESLRRAIDDLRRLTQKQT